MTDKSFCSQLEASCQPAESQLPYSILACVLLERPAPITRQVVWNAAAAWPTENRAAHARLSFGEIIAAAVPFLVALLMIAGFVITACPLLAEGLPIFANQSGFVRQADAHALIVHPPAIAALSPRQS